MNVKYLSAILVGIGLLWTPSALAEKKPLLKSKVLSSAQIMRLSGQAALSSEDDYVGDLYNGNRDIFITEVSVYVRTQKEGALFPRIYLCTIDIAPLSSVPFRLDIVVGDQNADYTWGIIEAKGYVVDPSTLALHSSRYP